MRRGTGRALDRKNFQWESGRAWPVESAIRVYIAKPSILSAVGRLWGHLDRYPLRGVVVAQERPGTLGGGLDVVAVRGEAAPAPQAHRTAPYRPRYSLDQRTAG